MKMAVCDTCMGGCEVDATAVSSGRDGGWWIAVGGVGFYAFSGVVVC